MRGPKLLVVFLFTLLIASAAQAANPRYFTHPCGENPNRRATAGERRYRVLEDPFVKTGFGPCIAADGKTKVLHVGVEDAKNKTAGFYHKEGTVFVLPAGLNPEDIRVGVYQGVWRENCGNNTIFLALPRLQLIEETPAADYPEDHGNTSNNVVANDRCELPRVTPQQPMFNGEKGEGGVILRADAENADRVRFKWARATSPMDILGKTEWQETNRRRSQSVSVGRENFDNKSIYVFYAEAENACGSDENPSNVFSFKVSSVPCQRGGAIGRFVCRNRDQLIVGGILAGLGYAIYKHNQGDDNRPDVIDRPPCTGRCAPADQHPRGPGWTDPGNPGNPGSTPTNPGCPTCGQQPGPAWPGNPGTPWPGTGGTPTTPTTPGNPPTTPGTPWGGH
jgi:hypothetical protein